MGRMIILESKNEVSRCIFALHIAKILAKKKKNVLILDFNQMGNFLDFPKLVSNFKQIKEGEPYKLKINTITKNTDMMKLPNNIFYESIIGNDILNKCQILFDYLIEKYDYIICISFISENKIIQLLFGYLPLLLSLENIQTIDEKEVIKKVRKINNKNISFKIIMEEFDKKDLINSKKFLYLKKIFEGSLINQSFYLEEYLHNISFITPKIYSSKTIKNINLILDEINFYKIKN